MTHKSLVPNWFKGLIVTSMIVTGYGLTHPAVQTPAPAPVAESAVAAPMASDLYDILWIDKYPTDPTDTWKAYLYTSDNIGLSVDAFSAFKLTLEVFEFKADKTRIGFHFPHDKRRAQCAYKIEKMKKPNKHFDTQLTVENDPQFNGVTHVYYTGPEFRSIDTMPEEIRASLESNQVIQNSLGKH